MSHQSLLDQLDQFNEQQLRRILVEHLTERKLGLHWEANLIERDQALNADLVFPRLMDEYSHALPADGVVPHLVTEGDNFDALRMLRSTHRGQVRVIYIDPPYNTGNKDWVYNDHYVGANDRYRHSQWLEFLYQRLCLARDLLTSDGVIMVSINDENRSRLELLMEEVMPGRRLGSLVWRTKDTGNDLSQRFSHVHEHVLVYANSGFKFNGKQTDRSKFRNTDNDERGDWSPQPLTKSHTYIERENTYYPIQNPKTGYWYPCDPDSVWRYASELEIRSRLKNEEVIQSALAALRSDTIEQLIAKELIYFPACKAEEVMQFDSREALLAAIGAGKGPILPKKKTPLLRADLPDLDFWIGKPIATGRPSRKELWTAKPEEDRLAPLSSWIAGVNEDVDSEKETDIADEVLFLRSTRGGVATDEIKDILGSKAFSYPKPLSLIKNLLQQATHPNDIVLDFFAGSGTTGQAVLELNAEDEGNRRFILCSSTEATTKEPNKNLCRDVCAERMRRVMQGYGNKPGLGGSFAYLQLDKYQEADVQFEVTPAHAAQLLSLQANHGALAGVAAGDSNYKTLGVIPIASDGQLAIVLVPDPNEVALNALLSWPGERLVIYSTRPQTVAQYFSDAGREVISRSLHEALLRGQTSGRKS